MISKLFPVEVIGKNAVERFSSLSEKLQTSPKGSMVLAPELALCNYQYEGEFFEQKTLDFLISQTIDKSLAFTHFKIDGFSRYNEFLFIQNGKILHSQCKYHLFKPNNEHNIFTKPDNLNKVKLFETSCGLKIGVLICFELRFVDLWVRFKGCDVILVPAMWGEKRKEHYEKLLNALAILLNCYVVFSSGGNKMLQYHGVFDPNGDYHETIDFNKNDIKKIKKSLGLQ